MKKATKQKIGVALKRIFGILAGTIILSVSYHAFIMPFGLLSGGATGLALVGNYILDVPLQLGILFLNIPIFIWGLKDLKKDFIITSAISTLTLVIVIPIVGRFLVKPDLDIFLASIFSGVVNGIGAGLVFRCGSSLGGVDIIAMIMKKKKNISIGAFSFACNLVVLAISLIFFPLKIAMYTAVAMFIMGRVIDLVIDGFNRNKSVMIITEKSQEVADRIIQELQRGVTLLEGLGAYTHARRYVLNCVITTYEVPKIKEIILQVDPEAFMFITDTVEVSGRGFTIPKSELMPNLSGQLPGQQPGSDSPQLPG